MTYTRLSTLKTRMNIHIVAGLESVFCLFVCLFFVSISNVKSLSTFSRLLIMLSSDLTISDMTFVIIITVIILFLFDYTE